MEKATQLDPERALTLMGEAPFDRAARSTWFSPYIMGLPTGSDWAEVAATLPNEGELDRDAIRSFVPSSSFSNAPPRSPAIYIGGNPSKEQFLRTIASRWGEENLDEAVHWFTSENQREFSDPETAKMITMVLPSHHSDHLQRALDWIADQNESPEWRKEVIVNYGKRMANLPPDEHADRLVSMLDRQEDRQALVEEFMGNLKKPSSSGHANLRHQAEQLRPFVEAADLDPKVTAVMLEMLETRMWQALPN
jgi:hypothetical protein